MVSEPHSFSMLPLLASPSWGLTSFRAIGSSSTLVGAACYASNRTTAPSFPLTQLWIWRFHPTPQEYVACINHGLLNLRLSLGSFLQSWSLTMTRLLSQLTVSNILFQHLEHLFSPALAG